MSKKFTNIFADGEVTGQNPDAGSDYFELADYGRDHNYWQEKLCQALISLASDPSANFYIIEGGEVTDSGSGQIDIARGTGIGKDASGNVRLVTVPALTNIPIPSGWNDGRQLWVIGKYTYKLSSETRAHFNGETYHQVLTDSYVGETNSDDLFLDADPGDTVIVWGSISMNGTTFTDLASRTRKTNHLNTTRGLLFGGCYANGNNPPTLRSGLYDVQGTMVRKTAVETSTFAANSMGDTAIANNYWYYLMVDAYGRIRTHIAFGDQFLGSTNIQSIASVGGGIFEIRVLNAVDLSAFSIGMVIMSLSTTATGNRGVFESTAFSNANDSGGAGFKYIRVKNSSGVVQAGAVGTIKIFYRIASVTTAANTEIYSPLPTKSLTHNHFVSDYDSSFRPVASYYSNGSGVVTHILPYGSAFEKNDDFYHQYGWDAFGGGSSTQIAKPLVNTIKAWGENIMLTTNADGALVISAARPGFIKINFNTYKLGGLGAFGVSLNSTQLSTSLDSINAADILGWSNGEGPQGNYEAPICENDKLYIHGSGVAPTTIYLRIKFRPN